MQRVLASGGVEVWWESGSSVQVFVVAQIDQVVLDKMAIAP